MAASIRCIKSAALSATGSEAPVLTSEPAVPLTYFEFSNLIVGPPLACDQSVSHVHNFRNVPFSKRSELILVA